LRQKLLLYNPAAGGGVSLKKITLLCRLFEKYGWPVLPCPTTGPETASPIIKTFYNEVDGVIILGGDGTINECLSALVDTSLFMSVIPAGTANVLAHEIGMPRRLREAVPAIVNGEVRPVTVGKAGEKYFVAFLGVGFDAHVADEVSRRLKNKIGRVAYVLEIVRQLFRYDFPRADFLVGNQKLTSSFAIVANTKLYGGNLMMAPFASLQSPELDLCLFKAADFKSFIHYFYRIVRKTHFRCKSVSYMKIQQMIIKSDAQVPFQIDGEPAGYLPLEIHSLPNALKLVFPANKNLM